MTDVTLNDMKFSCGGQQVVIPFDPPMKSLREARERLVQLDKEALEALGRSDITVTRYSPPHEGNILHVINFTQCLVTYIAFSYPANFRPGSLLYDNLLSSVPRFSGFCLAIQPFLLGIMLSIHVTETVIMYKKLARHGLTLYDAIWWAWMGSAFVEGVTSFKRMDALIEEKRKVKESKKH